MKKIKKLLCAFLVCLLALGLVACAGDNTPEDSNTGEVDNQESTDSGSDTGDNGNNGVTDDGIIKLDADATFLKLLDERQQFSSTGITCDWSCAGIEFTAECEGDITIGVLVDSSTGCYFRAYVDNTEWKNGDTPYYECLSGTAEIVLKDIPNGTHTIRIVKATGYTLARTTLVSLKFENGTPSTTAPADKEMFIEYIGDSIFCGWGVVQTPWGAYNGTYQSQDGTLAIPYLVSNEFNADYSVVAVSGQGVVRGDPNIENAYKYASYDRDKTTEYGFERKADVVVVNVGTNDYAKKDSISADEFATAYKRMLEYVRAKNGDDCIILVTYNMMNDGYGSRVEEVISQLGGVEENYYIVKSERCSAVNSTHPSAEENVAYAKVISDTIKAIMDGSYIAPNKTEMLIGTGASLAEADIPSTPWKEN